MPSSDVDHSKMKKRMITLRAVDPARLPGTLRSIGGSNSDSWNNLIGNQVIAALWTKHSDEVQTKEKSEAAISALIGIGPRDELKGMMAAQLIAAHDAAMECYRRAMLPEQTAEGRRENLSQANKLSRTYTILLEARTEIGAKGIKKLRSSMFTYMRADKR